MEALAATLGCTDLNLAESEETYILDTPIQRTSSLARDHSGADASAHPQPSQHHPRHHLQQKELTVITSQSRRRSIEAATTTPRFIATPPLSIPKAGESSPSQVCMSRQLTTAIATNPQSNHPTLHGRPTILLSTPTSALSTNHNNNNGSSNINGSSNKMNRRGSLSRFRRSNTSSPMLEKTSTPRSVTPLPPSCQDESGGINGQMPMPRRKSMQKSHSAPVMDPLHDYTGFQNIPAPLRLDAWSEAPAESFNIRSTGYMTNRKKEPSMPSAFRLLTVDLVNVETPLYNGICNHPNERFQQALRRERETGERQLPDFVFAVNLCVPGSMTYHCVSYFAIDNMDDIVQRSTPFGRVMYDFIFGDSDAHRDRTFKLIPRVAEGNFVVKKAVGTKPSILGKKIKQYHIRGDRFFEIIVDISSDRVAQKIVKLALGYTKTLVVDMMYVLEGTSEDTLPERIFGGIQMRNIDFKNKDGRRHVASPQVAR